MEVDVDEKEGSVCSVMEGAEVSKEGKVV